MSQDITNCIFCLDNEGKLLINNKCPCNYVFHTNCYDSYNKKNMCPMCRATVPIDYEIIEVNPVHQVLVIPRPVELITNYTQLNSGPIIQNLQAQTQTQTQAQTQAQTQVQTQAQINSRVNTRITFEYLLCPILTLLICIIIIIYLIIILD
jgi:hypothetical protein